ncbi:hypothetical protein [Actinocorallia populi]|uniref:hypothetical protein n=1 Tax=Actinocorallia populi TaxID=2079200 RepID=UPI000D086794|nr:hypothetical protein [Actinocorallia populi]
MIGWIVAVGGSVAAFLVTSGITAWQTRETARQTKISNRAALQEMRWAYVAGLREVSGHLLQWPELRQYVLEGKPCPEEGDDRARVLLIAEMYADVLQVGLNGVEEAMSEEEAEVWVNYCRDMLKLCPALEDLLRTHPGWWKTLDGLLEEVTALEGPAQAA